MPLRAAGVAILSFHFDHILSNEAGTLRGENPEALHDMRVATRRLRAALRDFRGTIDQETLESLVEDVRWLADLLGRIRDLDVFLQWLNDYAETVPKVERPFVQRIIENRQAARGRRHAALRSALRSRRYQQFKRTFSSRLGDHAVHSANESGTLISLAASKIERQLKRIRRFKKKADLGHPGRLHRLRIACRRLRYTSESFSILFPDFPQKLIDRSRNMQDLLGIVHDAAVQSQFLKRVRRRELDDPPMCEALSRMIRALDREQRAKYKEFERKYRTFGSKKHQRKIKQRLESSMQNQKVEKYARSL